MEKIILFKGSKRDFEDILEQDKIQEEYTPFMELIRQYNEKIRANDVYATNDLGGFEKNILANVVIYADDYASVTDHVITNFNNIVLLGHDIKNLYIHNPPKRVEYSLKVEFSNIIENVCSTYTEIDKYQITDFYENLCSSRVIGQKKAKKDMAVGLLKKVTLYSKSPLVALFYGPSGVGKTELSKVVSEYFNGTLTRIQFSMMQTEEAYKYIFGDVHGKNSLAKDLLARETNIVLIDEFDKVNPALYNAFYQMFDEGRLEDINYSVDVSNCIFILTSNFLKEEEIADKLGLPIFSRIDMKVEFQNLTEEEIVSVIEFEFKKVMDKLHKSEQKIINQYGLLDVYLKSIKSFENIRLLNSFIEKDIFELLFNNMLKNKRCK